MPDGKKIAINYTSRDFDTIKKDLINYAKTYYANTYQDFSEAGFGSLMMDTVSYVGDILSFYVDYQANESYLSTALEYQNIIKLARQNGYKLNVSPSSYGMASFYIQIPSDTIRKFPQPSIYTSLETRFSVFYCFWHRICSERRCRFF